MQLGRALELLVLGLSAISFAEATFNVNGVGRDGKGIQRRQEDSSSSDAATTSSPTVKTTSTPERTTTIETTTPTRTTSTAQTQTPTTSATGNPPPSSSTSKQTSSSTTADNTAPSLTEAPPSTSVTESAGGEPTRVTIVTVWTSTAADGSQVTLTSQTVSTSTPGLANNSSGQESGMSPTTRNTVIGVVVGVGGAIILGGLALVAWRIWGRKKHQEENDGLMDYGSTVEKPDSGGAGSMSGRTPFQSTLESYHAPTQVNTAANF